MHRLMPYLYCDCRKDERLPRFEATRAQGDQLDLSTELLRRQFRSGRQSAVVAERRFAAVGRERQWSSEDDVAYRRPLEQRHYTDAHFRPIQTNSIACPS